MFRGTAAATMGRKSIWFISMSWLNWEKYKLTFFLFGRDLWPHREEEELEDSELLFQVNFQNKSEREKDGDRIRAQSSVTC